MAQKRTSRLQEPPAAASSEEEETSSGEEDVSEEGNSSEGKEEVAVFLPKKTDLPASASATGKKVASKKLDQPMILPEEESSSEYTSRSDSEPSTEAGKSVKPIALKPMEETLRRKKPRGNENTTVSSSEKRSSEGRSQSRKTKRAKKGSKAHLDDGAATENDSKTTGDEKRKLFQRLWSEEDEIVILKGIIDFTTKKGLEPQADLNGFHEFIKKHVQVAVSISQLRNKIRTLKKKYKNNARRWNKGGKPTFAKPHDQIAFGLARKIWGNENEILQEPLFNETPINSQRASTSKTSKEKLVEKQQNIEENDDGSLDSSSCLKDFLDFYKNCGLARLPEKVVRRGFELLEESKKAELEEQWKKLHRAELELFVRRAELVCDQIKLVVEASKSSSK